MKNSTADDFLIAQLESWFSFYGKQLVKGVDRAVGSTVTLKLMKQGRSAPFSCACFLSILSHKDISSISHEFCLSFLQNHAIATQHSYNREGRRSLHALHCVCFLQALLETYT